jgi:hypothetical protein
VGFALDTKRDWSELVRAALGCASCNIKLLPKQGEIVFDEFRTNIRAAGRGEQPPVGVSRAIRHHD